MQYLLKQTSEKQKYYAENLGVYKVYWSMPTKWARTQTKTIHTSDVWKRYDIYTEAIIPPYQFPKWEDQGISFGKIPKPHNVTVKLAILKNEFRFFRATANDSTNGFGFC